MLEQLAEGQRGYVSLSNPGLDSLDIKAICRSTAAETDSVVEELDGLVAPAVRHVGVAQLLQHLHPDARPLARLAEHHDGRLLTEGRMVGRHREPRN